MKRPKRTRKKAVKNACINSKEEPRSIRRTVIRWCETGVTTMGAGNSQVYDVTTDSSQNENSFMEPSLLIQTPVMDNSVNTNTSQKDGEKPDPTKRCPVCSSTLKPAFINGQSNNEMLRCPRCPITQLLCGLCLYPCTSAACNNKLCALVSTLLTCEVVTDPKSNVSGCPIFRACPKCYSLIMHEAGCKHVTCKSCRYRFCFICLESDCSKDLAHYWTLTCAKQTAKRQRFIQTEP